MSTRVMLCSWCLTEHKSSIPFERDANNLDISTEGWGGQWVLWRMIGDMIKEPKKCMTVDAWWVDGWWVSHFRLVPKIKLTSRLSFYTLLFKLQSYLGTPDSTESSLRGILPHPRARLSNPQGLNCCQPEQLSICQLPRLADAINYRTIKASWLQLLTVGL